MLKFFIVPGLLLISQMAQASPLDLTLSVKERLRLSLWYEGIEEARKNDGIRKNRQRLREEIEAPLKKIDLVTKASI